MDSTWKGYQNANDVYALPQSTNPEVAKYETSDSSVGKTGFQDLKPSYPEIQANYDAMSGNWKGVKASDKAALKGGDFKSGFMPLDQ
jgi:hypothetical protein